MEGTEQKDLVFGGGVGGTNGDAGDTFRAVDWRRGDRGGKGWELVVADVETCPVHGRGGRW